MNPELDNGRGGFRLDEKIAVSVGLAVGIPLVVLFLLWCRGLFFPGTPEGGSGLASESPRVAPPPATAASGARTAPPAPGEARQGTALEGATRAFSLKLAGAPGTATVDLAARAPRGAGNALPDEVAAELEFLREDQQRLRTVNQGLEAQVQELQKEFAGAKALNAKILRDAQSREQQLNEFIRTLQAELEKGKSRIGALEAEAGKLRSDSARLAKQGEELKKLQAALEAANQKGEERDAVLQRAQGELQALKEKEKATQAQVPAKAVVEPPAAPMQPGTAPAELAAAKSANANLQAQVDEFRKQLDAALKASSAAEKKVPEAQAAVAERVRALEAENKRLQEKLRVAPAAAAPEAKAPIRARVIESRTAGKPLPQEVRKADDLWEGAAPLNEFLRQAAKAKVSIPERDEAARTGNVGQLITRLRFGKGKSRVEPAEEAKLESALSQSVEAGYLLIVGYASLPGCNQQNEALSRRRAEAVSAAARKRLKEGVQVQTMFFGETDQFDSEREEENQVVEIWRVGS